MNSFDSCQFYFNNGHCSNPTVKEMCRKTCGVCQGLSIALNFSLSFKFVNELWKYVLKLINYSCSSYPTRAFYSGQVDEVRNPMKNELKTRPCLKPVFETISNTDANFLNLHIDKATKTRGDKQLYLITHFTKQTLNLNYLLLTLTVTEQFLENPKQKRPFFLNSRSMMATSCFGSLSTLLYTSNLKWHWR